jgi:ribosomal 50S subunit-recycling heat shock protein
MARSYEVVVGAGHARDRNDSGYAGNGMNPSDGRSLKHVDETRIDAWLWAARFFKTRALAKQMVERGRVSRGDAVCKPAQFVHPGDVLRIVRGEETFVVEVTAVAAKRGAVALAQAL